MVNHPATYKIPNSFCAVSVGGASKRYNLGCPPSSALPHSWKDQVTHIVAGHNNHGKDLAAGCCWMLDWLLQLETAWHNDGNLSISELEAFVPTMATQIYSSPGTGLKQLLIVKDCERLWKWKHTTAILGQHPEYQNKRQTSPVAWLAFNTVTVSHTVSPIANIQH